MFFNWFEMYFSLKFVDLHRCTLCLFVGLRWKWVDRVKTWNSGWIFSPNATGENWPSKTYHMWIASGFWLRSPGVLPWATKFRRTCFPRPNGSHWPAISSPSNRRPELLGLWAMIIPFGSGSVVTRTRAERNAEFKQIRVRWIFTKINAGIRWQDFLQLYCRRIGTSVSSGQLFNFIVRKIPFHYIYFSEDFFEIRNFDSAKFWKETLEFWTFFYSIFLKFHIFPCFFSFNFPLFNAFFQIFFLIFFKFFKFLKRFRIFLIDQWYVYLRKNFFRHAWSDETGRTSLSKEAFQLPSGSWRWDTEWQVDYHQSDEDGWRYSFDFPAAYHPQKSATDYVRRRRWHRTMKVESAAPWLPGPATKLRSVSICPGVKAGENIPLWGVTVDGSVVLRDRVTTNSPQGDSWIPVTFFFLFSSIFQKSSDLVFRLENQCILGQPLFDQSRIFKAKRVQDEALWISFFLFRKTYPREDRFYGDFFLRCLGEKSHSVFGDFCWAVLCVGHGQRRHGLCPQRD